MEHRLTFHYIIAICALLANGVAQSFAAATLNKRTVGTDSKVLQNAYMLLIISAIMSLLSAIAVLTIFILVHNDKLTSGFLYFGVVFCVIAICSSGVLSTLAASKIQCYYNKSDVTRRQINASLAQSLIPGGISILAILGMVAYQLWKNRKCLMGSSTVARKVQAPAPTAVARPMPAPALKSTTFARPMPAPALKSTTFARPMPTQNPYMR